MQPLQGPFSNNNQTSFSFLPLDVIATGTTANQNQQEHYLLCFIDFYDEIKLVFI